ncbi:MAG TPA: hypothetical protein VJT83_02340 [Chitinophagaceae bacterium]|nr:hypothetical protein [Chitinophagaceae bacterium]
MENKDLYIIPEKYRKMENMHILFWLVKDTCWCLSFRWLGITMIFPTLLVAVLICWRTKHMMSEFSHNLAIIFWISANSLWMISEFFNWGDDFRYWALIPFGLGLATLIYYYGYYVPFKDKPLSGSSTADRVSS